MSSRHVPSRGVLTVSVDLELDVDRLSVEHGRVLEAVTERLLAIFARHKIPATWAVADPAHSAVTERILNQKLGHEVAVLGDSSWVGAVAGRSRFAKELSRRVMGARADGLPLETLVSTVKIPDDHLDLVVKHRLTALRNAVDGRPSGQAPAQPNALHFGLWEVPVSRKLPGTSRVLPGGGHGIRIRHGIDRAAIDCKLFHLVVDGPRLGAAGRWALPVLERVLRHASRCQHQERLDIITLGEIASRLSKTERRVGSRSILRPTG